MQRGRCLAAAFKGAEIQMEITAGVENKTITADPPLLERGRMVSVFTGKQNIPATSTFITDVLTKDGGLSHLNMEGAFVFCCRGIILAS